VDYFFYSYDCCPSEPWPVVAYTIDLARSSLFYGPFVLIPGVLITILSFAVFWVDAGVVDPLGYGIGIIIVILLLNVVLIEMLPVCGELLWIDLFGLVNTGFCCISLLVSGLLIMLRNHDSEHFFYTFIAVGLNQVWKFCCCCCRPSSKDRDLLGPDMSMNSETEILSSSKYVVESVAGIIFRQKETEIRTCGPVPGAGKGEKEERMRKLIFFENLFYKIDVDGDNEIDTDEVERLLCFCAVDLDPEERPNVFKKYDVVADGQLNRMEFVKLCVDILWNTPTQLIDMMVENMLKSRNAKENSNQAYWSGVAKVVEQRARIAIPLVYFFLLAILFNIDMRDPYKTDLSSPMFSGFAPNIAMTSHGIFLVVSMAVFIVVGLISTQLIHRALARKEKQIALEQKEAGRFLSARMSFRKKSLDASPNSASSAADWQYDEDAAKEEEAQLKSLQERRTSDPAARSFPMSSPTTSSPPSAKIPAFKVDRKIVGSSVC